MTYSDFELQRRYFIKTCSNNYLYFEQELIKHCILAFFEGKEAHENDVITVCNDIDYHAQNCVVSIPTYVYASLIKNLVLRKRKGSLIPFRKFLIKRKIKKATVELFASIGTRLLLPKKECRHPQFPKHSENAT